MCVTNVEVEGCMDRSGNRDLYNQQVTESGLAGLHVGLCKAGTGTLALTGTNTYEGSSITAGGTLEIDGSVAGDAWSIMDSSAGTTLHLRQEFVQRRREQS